MAGFTIDCVHRHQYSAASFRGPNGVIMAGIRKRVKGTKACKSRGAALLLHGPVSSLHSLTHSRIDSLPIPSSVPVLSDSLLHRADSAHPCVVVTYAHASLGKDMTTPKF